MAKKKSSKSQSGAASSKSAKGGGSKAAQPSTPVVDTSLAAQMAARLLAARAKLQGTAPTAEPQKESASFKQLKESLNRPAQHVITNAMGNTFGEHKSNLPMPGKQVAHNQTQANIARINVPRRTAG